MRQFSIRILDCRLNSRIPLFHWSLTPTGVKGAVGIIFDMTLKNRIYIFQRTSGLSALPISFPLSPAAIKDGAAAAIPFSVNFHPNIKDIGYQRYRTVSMSILKF